MTLEELKAEANRLGYNLIKKQEPVKLLPCICGYKYRSLWHDTKDGTCFLACDGCDFRGYKAKNKYRAKIAWNKAIEDRQKEFLGEGD